MAIVSCAHFVEIDTAGNAAVAIVVTIPNHGVASGGHITINEGADFLSKDIVDIDADGSGLFEAEVDGGAGVKGIGVVAFQLRNDGDDVFRS